MRNRGLSKHVRALLAFTGVESYCCKFYSDQDKHMTVNCLSITEAIAELYSKDHIEYTHQIYFVFG